MPKRRPTWIGSWLEWVLGELLESPGEHQTEIAWRHFVRDQPAGQDMIFYRIDMKLEEDIRVDDAGEVEQLAEMIDWQAILAGTDEVFRVREDRTLFPQYAKRRA